eukprot:264155_1
MSSSSSSSSSSIPSTATSADVTASSSSSNTVPLVPGSGPTPLTSTSTSGGANPNITKGPDAYLWKMSVEEIRSWLEGTHPLFPKAPLKKELMVTNPSADGYGKFNSTQLSSS